MNTQTKQALEKFADEVTNLALAMVNTIGIQTAADVTTAAMDLKRALAKDETILEVR